MQKISKMVRKKYKKWCGNLKVGDQKSEHFWSIFVEFDAFVDLKQNLRP
jgi:hypothetical protein